MFRGLKRILQSRILYVGLILLFELILFGLFAFVVVNSFINVFKLEVWQAIIILFIIFYIISFILIVYIVNTNGNSAYKVAWICLIALVPLFGSVFYLLFGNKKITNRQKRRMQPLNDLLKIDKIDEGIVRELNDFNPECTQIADYIVSSNAGDIYKNTETKYFESGEKSYETIIKEIRKAKKFVLIEFFIINNGFFWESILNELIILAKKGVDIRLIYDDVGSVTMAHSYVDKLKEYGIKAYIFRPFKPLLDVKLNNRDHRKIIVIDGFVGFSGGINLSDEYINKTERFGYWKDNVIYIRGDAVKGLTSLFLSQWFLVSGDDLTNVHFSDDEYRGLFPSVPKICDDGFVQPYGSHPNDDSSIGENVYLNLINRAHKYVYITTPYLIISDELKSSLIRAAKSGIDIRLITPRIPDKKTTFRITRSYYRDLLKNGIKIYEFEPGFVHMKMFIVDDIMATIGTVNLDFRSLYLHYENGIILYGSSSIKDMKDDFIETMNQSINITYKDFLQYATIRRFAWAILRLFAPLV